MKLSPLNFHLSIIIIEKRLGESVTVWLGESASRWEKKDSIEIVFSHMKVVFSSPKFAKKTIFCPKTSVEFIKILL